MTSASTHRLRSAVGVCAKPSHSYRSSRRYTGGGCLDMDDSPFRLSNFSKKRNSCNDCDRLLFKKNKNASEDARLNRKNARLDTANADHLRESFSDKYKGALLNGFSKDLTSSDGLFKPSDLFNDKLTCNTGQRNTGINKSIEKVFKNNNNNNKYRTTGFDENISRADSPRVHSSETVSSANAGVKTNLDDFDDGDGTAAKKNDTSGVNAVDVNIRENNSISGDSDKLANWPGWNIDEFNKKVSDSVPTWLSKSSVTRRTAHIYREVSKAWQARFGSSHYATNGQIRLLLDDLRLLLSKSQVDKTLESAGRVAPMHISFKEFCCSLAERRGIRCDTGLPRASQAPRLVGKDGNHQPLRRNRKSTKAMCKYDVFLGGSCNPTTWRTEIAIPDLEKMGITYFNPQVSQWRPDLVEVEHRAKENATVMFFVVDNQTRAISTLIEAAHIAACKRKLILVIQCYAQEKRMICGEVISQEECEDLKNGQKVLQELVESQGIPVFANIRLALKYTETILRKNLTVQELDVRESPEDMRASPRCPREKTMEVREAFDVVDTYGNGELDLEDACLALQMITDSKISIDFFREVADRFGTCKDADREEGKISFQQFSSLVTTLKSIPQKEELLQGKCPLLRSDSSGARNSDLMSPMRDVFLGGTIKDTSWRETTAIPLLKKNNLTFFNPKAEIRKRFSPIEAAAVRNSRCLLFVITNSARSVAEMAVAGHYIGLGCNMVLCVEHFAPDAAVGTDKLSENAVKDYNRGRMYLTDIAQRSGVPVFGSIFEAIMCVVGKLERR